MIGDNSRDSLLNKARSLYESDLYSSAIFLLGLQYSKHIDAKELDTRNALETHILYARACMRLRLFRRALKLWELAYNNIHLRKGLDVDINLYTVLQEYGECAFLLGLLNVSLKILLEIPNKHRSAKAWILLGNIYENSFSVGLARKSYISALEVSHYAVEAVDGALRTGADLETVIGIIWDGSEDMQWIIEYSKAEHALIKSDYKGFFRLFISLRDVRYGSEHISDYPCKVSYDILSKLNTKFSSSIELAQSLFTCNYLSGNHAEAYKDYERILTRDLDPLVCAPMQAVLLKERGKIDELDSLRKNIYSTGKGTPECYLVSANFADATGDIPRALRCVEKALKIRNRSVDAWVMKGYLLSRDKKYINALEAFWVAESVRGSLESYEGIVKCLLKLKRVGEATAVSTMVAKKHTRNSRVMVLCVEVILTRKDSNYLKEAKYLLQKALSINKHCLAAIKKYTQVLMQEKEYDAALEFVDENIKTMDFPILRSLKGDIYVCKYNFYEAKKEYFTALHLDPRCSQAKKGLAHIQTLFKNDGSRVSFKNTPSIIDKGQDSDEALI